MKLSTLIVVTSTVLLLAPAGLAQEDAIGMPEPTEEHRALEVFVGFSAYIIFLILFPLALLLELLFPRTLNFAENYVLLAYVQGHTTWIQLVQVVLMMHLPVGPVLLLNLLLMAYTLWVLAQLHGKRWSVLLRGVLFVLMTLVVNTFFLNAGLLITMRHVLGTL